MELTAEQERKMRVKFVMDETGTPFVTPQELLEILWDRGDLIYLCLQLYYLSRLKVEIFVSQPNVAKILGMNYCVYLKKRKELENLKFLEVTIRNNNFTEINLIFLKTIGLSKNNRGSIEKQWTPPNFRTPQEIKEYIANTGLLLSELAKKEPVITGQSAFFDNIYINTNKTNNNTNTSITNKVNSKSTIVKGKTYPKEDYGLVLDAFKKYKGVGLMGPEISYHLRAIKMMFQAEHKPKDIIDFMKWLHDNEKNEETSWVRTWTIWTVQKKIPEFLGGKLKVRNNIEEEYPAYGK